MTCSPARFSPNEEATLGLIQRQGSQYGIAAPHGRVDGFRIDLIPGAFQEPISYLSRVCSGPPFQRQVAATPAADEPSPGGGMVEGKAYRWPPTGSCWGGSFREQVGMLRETSGEIGRQVPISWAVSAKRYSQIASAL